MPFGIARSSKLRGATSILIHANLHSYACRRCCACGTLAAPAVVRSGQVPVLRVPGDQAIASGSGRDGDRLLRVTTHGAVVERLRSIVRDAEEHPFTVARIPGTGSRLLPGRVAQTAAVRCVDDAGPVRVNRVCAFSAATPSDQQPAHYRPGANAGGMACQHRIVRFISRRRGAATTPRHAGGSRRSHRAALRRSRCERIRSAGCGPHSGNFAHSR